METWRKQLRHLVLYGMIGLACSTVDYVIFSVLTMWGLNYIASNIVSAGVGITCSFMLNRSYNFRTHSHTTLRFLSFLLVCLTGLATSTCLLAYMIGSLGWHLSLSKLAAMAAAALLQFTLNSCITFRDKS